MRDRRRCVHEPGWREYGYRRRPAQSINAVFIATGQNYPDALVSGGAAGYVSSPMLLVNVSAGTLDTATTRLLTTLAPKRIYIIGGDSAVSAGGGGARRNSRGPFCTAAVRPVLRLSGADRFATADAVKEKVFPFADISYLATAYVFADAQQHRRELSHYVRQLRGRDVYFRKGRSDSDGFDRNRSRQRNSGPTQPSAAVDRKQIPQIAHSADAPKTLGRGQYHELPATVACAQVPVLSHHFRDPTSKNPANSLPRTGVNPAGLHPGSIS
jgi:hypothetical protein